MATIAIQLQLVEELKWRLNALNDQAPSARIMSIHFEFIGDKPQFWLSVHPEDHDQIVRFFHKTIPSGYRKKEIGKSIPDSDLIGREDYFFLSSGIQSPVVWSSLSIVISSVSRPQGFELFEPSEDGSIIDLMEKVKDLSDSIKGKKKPAVDKTQMDGISPDATTAEILASLDDPQKQIDHIKSIVQGAFSDHLGGE